MGQLDTGSNANLVQEFDVTEVIIEYLNCKNCFCFFLCFLYNQVYILSQNFSKFQKRQLICRNMFTIKISSFSSSSALQSCYLDQNNVQKSLFYHGSSVNVLLYNTLPSTIKQQSQSCVPELWPELTEADEF